MFPYNRKVWAYDPAKLDVGWMGERVARPDVSRIRRNVELRKDDIGWGPNSTFRFPSHGGTGAIWRSIANQLPASRLHFGRTVTAVDGRQKAVTFAGGESSPYDFLISTLPLDLLLRGLTGRPELSAAADRFVHSSSHIVGVGLAGNPPEHLQTKCWIYFPEGRVPFYRATVFSNYSPNNAPPGHWSLMAEISESPDKPVDATRVIDETIAGFAGSGFIDPAAVVSRWHRRLEHGYPTPWLGRDEVLGPVEAGLRADGIFSRGRFGAWKYEVSNQDHSVMQGVETVNHLLADVRERTYFGDMSDA
jgi:protoporphyrinogen oxidase